MRRGSVLSPPTVGATSPAYPASSVSPASEKEFPPDDPKNGGAGPDASPERPADLRLAAPTPAIPAGDLGDAQPLAGGPDLHFHRPSEIRGVHLQGVERAQAQCPARGKIGILHTPESRHQRTGKTVTQPLAQSQCSDLPRDQCSAGKHEIGHAAYDRINQLFEEERIVTSVGIKKCDHVVVRRVTQGGEAGKTCRSVTESRFTNHHRPVCPGNFRRPIHRTVVHDDDRGGVARQTIEHTGQGLLLVSSGNHNVHA